MFRYVAVSGEEAIVPSQDYLSYELRADCDSFCPFVGILIRRKPDIRKSGLRAPRPETKK